MAGRPPRGTIEVRPLSDGTRAFKLRFYADGRRELAVLHERGDCPCGCGGGWTERTAQIELENALAKVRAGVWRRREPAPRVARSRMPTFHEYASDWLQAKKDGVLGDRPISTNSEADYRSRLANHLLPFFGRYRLDDIDAELCLAFQAHKLKESAELRRAVDSGAALRDRRGRRVRPLGPAMIRKLIDCLATILDEAVDDGLLERNPARGRRMRVRVPKPARTFLEMDELVALTDAAGAQDRSGALSPAIAQGPLGATAMKVAERWQAGMRAKAIAADLDLSRATVTHHLRRLGAEQTGPYIGRRAIVATLGGSGVRVSELCDIRMRDLRLEAASGAYFRIPDAKTEAGIRDVQVSPDLVAELEAHLDQLRRAGQPTEPASHLFSNVRRRPDLPPAHREDPPRGHRPCFGRVGSARVAGTADHDTAHTAPHVHLRRAARKPVRRLVGDAASRPCRLEDDDGCLRAATAARRAAARRGVRCARPARTCAPLRHDWVKRHVHRAPSRVCDALSGRCRP